MTTLIERTASRRRRRYTLVFFSLVLLILWLPTPYYLYRPGTVEELSTKVAVADGHHEGEGRFYLTTVLSIKASHSFYLLYGLSAPHTTFRKSQSVKGDLSDAEYDKLLRHMMETSQRSAVAAGLRAAGERAEVRPLGVFVRSVQADSKVKAVLAVGDIISAVDGVPVTKAADFTGYLAGGSRQAGDTVNISFRRDGKETTKPVELTVVDARTNQVGVGIVPEDEFTLDAARSVKFHAEDIGGPSAGLMFALEIVSQARGGGLARGYRIAGTGTIDPDGRVGQIGGIRDKIVAAHNAGMDLFFCPADVRPGDANAKDAQDEASRRRYDLRVVPVRTLAEAVDYLEALPRRAS